MAAHEAAGAFESAERAVPVFGYPEAAAQALARVVELVEWRAKPSGCEPALDGVDHDAGRALVESVLAAHPEGAEMDAASAAALFKAYGIPLVPSRVVLSADEAMDGAAATGFPVILKGSDGVASAGLHTPAEVARAWDELPTGQAVVQPLLEPGVATAIEVSTHPSFGPLIAFGTAGPTAEIYGDRSLRVLPLTDVGADELIRSVKGAALFRGYRGQPGADLDALRDVLLRVSRLALDLPQVAALVLDPVIAAPTRAVAVDVRLAVAPYRTRPELALRRLR